MKKGSNSLIEDIINRVTYLLAVVGNPVFRTALEIDTTSNPLWVTGLFRSGTTITTRIIEDLGFDLGPKNHLLKAKGSRRKLNPDGFYENYLFMEWSLYLFVKINSWGDIPPEKTKVINLKYHHLSYKEFVFNAIVSIHDDRLSNFQKLKLLRRFHPYNLGEYLKNRFTDRPAVKNPHFIPLQPLLDRFWPNGKYLVTFRNPVDWLLSAKKVSPRVNYELYSSYYTRVLDHPQVIFLDYDNLVLNPKKSVLLLAQSLNVREYDSSVVDKINPSCKNSSQKEVPQTLKILYNNLQHLAINHKLAIDDKID
ncbi:MAG: sulfotransferase domain-containing protein [Nonlabens sp.]